MPISENIPFWHFEHLAFLVVCVGAAHVRELRLGKDYGHLSFCSIVVGRLFERQIKYYVDERTSAVQK